MIFSSAVLLKVVADDAKDPSITKKLLSKPLLDHEVLASLLLAYKVSLTRRLHDRDSLTRRWHKFGRLLGVKEQELDQRAVTTEQMSSVSPRKRIPQRTMERLKQHLKDSWKGDPEWVDLILESDQHRPQNLLLERTFPDVWSYACNDTLYAIRPQRNDSTLQCLEDRVQEQRTRIDQWRSVHNNLLKSSQTTQVDTQMQLTENVPPDHNQGYDKKSRVILETSTPASRSSRSRTTSSPSADMESGLHVSARRKAGHARSQSEAVQTPLGLRKHEGHVTKPLANTSARMAVTSRSSKAIPSSSPQDTYASDYDSQRGPVQPKRTTSYDDSYLDASYEHQENDNLPKLLDAHKTADDIVSSVLNAAPSPAKPLLSLAERTRMSMANTSTTKANVPLAEIGSGCPRPAPSRHKSTDSAVQIPASQVNLAERTRQSLFATAQTRPLENRRVSKPRASTMYPANQFQTPVKSFSDAEPTSASAFDETELHADYETIFKSRPRIAMSPVLKPTVESRESLESALGMDIKASVASYEDDFS